MPHDNRGGILTASISRDHYMPGKLSILRVDPKKNVIQL
ncbi:hypothetical protein CSB69_1893 [Morganella morganii]|nr:hypothetical protein CSB69_1893 [Morganella morganii]